MSRKPRFIAQEGLEGRGQSELELRGTAYWIWEEWRLNDWLSLEVW
jgi:hypothetical protein